MSAPYREQSIAETLAREFFAAIRENREPNASVHDVMPCYRTLAQLEKQIEGR